MNHELGGKAVAIKLRNFSSVQMRTFHMSWMAFFLAFFGWFGIAPMMALVRDDLQLTKSQIGDMVIASVLSASSKVRTTTFRAPPLKPARGLLDS